MMPEWEGQLEALGTALLLIQKLPSGTVWAVTITNDDNGNEPSVLNIFYSEPDTFEMLVHRLRLGAPVDMEDEFTSWRRGALLISLIKENEHV